MPDGFVRLRKGEKRPLYGKATAASETLLISEEPTCTLYDAEETVVGSAGMAVTGFDDEAAATVRAWYNLDTADLDEGFYTLVFKFLGTGTDDIERTYEPSVEIHLMAVTE